MPLNVQTQVTGNTITATVTGAAGGTIAVTIGGVAPTRVPLAGTPMALVEGTSDQFTIDVPGPGTYSINVTCGSESTMVSVTVPAP